MPLDRPLADLADTDSVENVVLFVADSTRLDALPDRIAERGVTAEGIAPSTWTASSLPSITSGRYPSEHGVWGFDGTRLPQKPALLREEGSESTGLSVGFDARTIWTHVESAEKPPLNVNHVESEVGLDALDPPFVHVVHDKGGHGPYGHSFAEWDATTGFFEAYADRPDELRSLYAESVADAADRFLDLVADLERRGVVSDTLVVFTSDHGELLGEASSGGIFGHGAPITPELVRVPVVFLGAGLPENRTLDALVSGVDLAPTLLGALGRDVPAGLDGRNLWTRTPPADRVPRSETWTHYTFALSKLPFSDEIASLDDHRVPMYAGSSVWSRDGGVVRQHNGRFGRVAFGLAGQLLFSGAASVTRAIQTPRSAFELLRTFASSSPEYGAVSETLRTASQQLPTDFEWGAEPAGEEGGLDREQLRQLGYVE